MSKLADLLVTSSNIATSRLATSVPTHSLLIMLDCIRILTRGGIYGEIKPEPRDFPRAQPIFHRTSQHESQYIYSQLQLQYYPSWEGNIERVYYPYCSVSWGYIFKYTPSRARPIRENISQLIEQYWRVKFKYYKMYRIFKHKLCHALGVIQTQKPPDRDDGQTF